MTSLERHPRRTTKQNFTRQKSVTSYAFRPRHVLILSLGCAASILAHPLARAVAVSLTKSAFPVLLTFMAISSSAAALGALALAGAILLVPQVRTRIKRAVVRSGLYRPHVKVLMLGLDNAGTRAGAHWFR